jgi:hypothetical protein
LDSIDVKSASVETKWSQEISKNSEVLRLMKKVSCGIVFDFNASVKTYGEILSYNWIKIFVGIQTQINDLVFLDLFSSGK